MSHPEFLELAFGFFPAASQAGLSRAVSSWAGLQGNTSLGACIPLHLSLSSCAAAAARKRRKRSFSGTPQQNISSSYIFCSRKDGKHSLKKCLNDLSIGFS